MPELQVGVVRNFPAGYTNDSADPQQRPLWLDSSASLVTMDFYAKALLDGRGYQVRAGTLSAPLVGDVVITDTAAEYCVDGATGLVFMPIYQCISINLGTGTLHEYATKEVATASSAGAAFVPLPLKAGARAASVTARVEAAGAVTVTAELATTTTRHWSADQPIAMGAYWMNLNWEPLRPPPVMGARCLYTQIAATTTGPSYYAALNIVQFLQTELGFA
jgi:hypothetical protein